MAYTLILNRSPRLFYLAAYLNKRRIRLTLVPGANIASKTGLSTEGIDAIRASEYVRDFEARGVLEFVTAAPEPAAEPEKKPKPKRKRKTKPEPGPQAEPEPEPEEGSDRDSDDF